jgi:predicted flap endonuclease-1-like 5' DNA nuclease
MENDDLEEIHGIGPKLAALLHSIGVHTFKQIALWDDTDINQMDEKLEEFKGRIRREGWVESARACHWRKYREALGGYTPPAEG